MSAHVIADITERVQRKGFTKADVVWMEHEAKGILNMAKLLKKYAKVH